jgi:hypothetical protein
MQTTGAPTREDQQRPPEGRHIILESLDYVMALARMKEYCSNGT